MRVRDQDTQTGFVTQIILIIIALVVLEFYFGFPVSTTIERYITSIIEWFNR
jgi:hypothetical protein